MDRPIGPSQFIKAPEVISAERRLRLRRSPLAFTYVTLGENNGGIVTNISETGMGMTAARPLRENSSSQLSFQLSELGPAIETRAEIVWMTESKKQAGFRFEGLPAEVREQIRNWVSSPARGNDKSQNGKEHPRNVEGHLPSGSTLRQSPFPAPAPEQDSAPKAAPDQGRDDASFDATPAQPARVQAPDSPPLVLGPALGPALEASLFRTGATDFVSETYKKRTSPIAALVALIVATCFALGFEASPDFFHNWPKADDARHVDSPDLPISKNPTLSANLAANPDETSDRAAEPLAPASSTPAPAEKTYHSKPEASERREMPRKTLAERPSSRAANSALNSATIPPAPAKTPATTGTTATSSPAKKSEMRGTESFTEQPAASNVSRADAASPPMPATLPAHAEEPATRPANPPPSFFPVIAPGAGNVPRLVELPPETVIDSATVQIHSRQIVFVPAEPGPESSHNPEKLQIGERISKVAPTYPAQAVQKGLGGTVHLHATINKNGTVDSVRPIKGPILLIPAALDAVRQWRYRPTLLDQQPTEMQEDLTIEFRPLG
jgi:TonB family protein